MENINYSEKISTFNLLVNNLDNEIALKYLQLANWDESKAALLYNNECFSKPSTKITNDQLLEKYPNIPIAIPKKNALSSWFSPFFSSDNTKYYSYFKDLPQVTKEYSSFCTQIKTRMGIIILYEKSNVSELKNLIYTIKQDPFTLELVKKNKIVYPVINDSEEGAHFTSQLSIKIFPAIVICKAKNIHQCAIIKKQCGNITLQSLRKIILDATAELESNENKMKERFTDVNNQRNQRKERYKEYESSNAQIIAMQENEKKMLEEMQRINEKKEKEKKEQMERQKEFEKMKKKLRENEMKKKKDNLPLEPEEGNENTTVIAFRFPDGETIRERRFLKSDKVQLMYTFVESLGREIYTEEENEKFEIIQTFPFKRFDNMERTLKEEGLFPNALIQIREK